MNLGEGIICIASYAQSLVIRGIESHASLLELSPRVASDQPPSFSIPIHGSEIAGSKHINLQIGSWGAARNVPRSTLEAVKLALTQLWNPVLPV